MSAHHNIARLSIDIPARDHKKLKAISAVTGKSIKDLVLSCLKEHLFSEKQPNEQTLKVFEETDRGEGLIICKDVDDMLKKLGLDE